MSDNAVIGYLLLIYIMVMLLLHFLPISHSLTIICLLVLFSTSKRADSAILIYQLCLSVCLPSVRHVAVLCTFRQTFVSGRSSTLDFQPYLCYKIPKEAPSAGALTIRQGRFLRFSIEIAVYIGNGTSYAQ